MEMVRRHARSNARFQFRPVVGAVAGNYVTAKRRGALGGAQLGLTGKVRFVQVEDLRMQLDAGNIVVMGVMGYSAGGACVVISDSAGISHPTGSCCICVFAAV